MANLRANKITSTEVFETTGSVQFDGTGDYLEIPNSSDLEFGNNSFTIEAWLYPVASGGSIFNIFYNKGVGLQCYWKSNTNKIEVYADSNNTTNYDILNSLNTPSGSIISGQWAHIAIVRNINVFQIYLNGIASGSSITNSASIGSNSNGVTIGDYKPYLSNYEFNGHISNLRVLKGTALYTKNFTPPSRELTVIPNTVLLACTSTTNTAQEATGKTITVNGNAVANELTPGLLTDRVKSGGTSAITGSVEFTGTQDALVLSAGQDFAYGTGDFTIEAWIQPQGLNGGETKAIFTQTQSGNDYIVFKVDSDKAIKATFGGTTITGGTVEVGSWNHVAVTRASNTVRVFVNGVASAGTTVSTDFSDTTRNPTIGQYTHTYGNIEYYGFISNLRVLKGTALYTGSFIPPSRELKRIPNTVLLCCKNSSDPTAEETGKTITANGDPAASNFTPQIGSDGSVTFDGVTKINTQNYFYIPTGNTENRGRGRGVFGGGSSNIIDYITIASTGNAVDFGDTSTSISNGSSLGSSTRGVIGGYSTPTTVNTIEYITFATTSNTLDFGDLTVARWGTSSTSSTTRGIFYSGYIAPANVNIIDYITIASIGNATDFGDATTAGRSGNGCGSPVRGIFASGVSPSTNVIGYLTISSTGNSIDFGDLTVGRFASAASSSTTRAVFSGGYVGPAGQLTNTIDYITISSTGNAQDFGDLTRANWSLGGLSNSIRGIIGGGYVAPVYNNNIDYLTISSTGNSQDFGDMTSSRGGYSACSDSHGGLG